MTKIFLCRLMALTFLFNVLAPDARLFAQAAPAGVDLSYIPAEDEEILAKNPHLIWPFKKSDSAVDAAQLRLFFTNASKNDFIDFITKRPLPADSYSMGMGEYIPGLNIQKTSAKSAAAAIKRLNSLAEKNALAMEDYFALPDSPSEEIAQIGMLWLYQSINQSVQMKDTETLYFLALTMLPQLQQKLLKRLDAVQKTHNKAAVFPSNTVFEKNFQEQYRSDNNIALRGSIHLLLGAIRQAFIVVNEADPVSPAKYKELTNQIMKTLEASPTLKERSMGANGPRILNAEYAAMNMMAYEGLDGFARVMDFFESQNTNTKFQTSTPYSFDVKKVKVPQQSVIKTFNFPLIQRAFMAFQAQYQNQATSRTTAMDSKEKAKLQQLLIKYANNGSAPTRVFALTLLSDFYKQSASKWTRGQGFDKGAKSGLFISEQTANQVADLIKNNYYCPLQQTTKSGMFGFESNEMLQMSQMLAEAYNNIRQDPQQVLLKEGQTRDCYVALTPTLNKSAQAQELTEVLMSTLLFWIGFDSAIFLVAKAGRYAGNVSRAAKIALKAPKASRTATFTAALRDAKEASKFARELAKNGVKIEQTLMNAKKGQQVTRDMTRTRVPSPAEVPLSYTVTQRLPEGIKTVQTIAAEGFSNSTKMLAQNGVKASPITSQFAQFFKIAGEASSAIPKGAEGITYRSLIATEDIFASGLKAIADKNLATGHKMIGKLVPDASGKLAQTYEPVFLRLSATDPVAHYNAAGQMITGNVRMDLLGAIERPGTVFTAELAKPGAITQYLKRITNITVSWYGYDRISYPLLNLWNEAEVTDQLNKIAETKKETQQPTPSAEEQEAPTLEEQGPGIDIETEKIGVKQSFFQEIDPADGSIVFLTGKAIAWPFATGIPSLFTVGVKPNQIQLLKNNPYMKMYQEKAAKEKQLEEEAKEQDELLREFQNQNGGIDPILQHMQDKEDEELLQMSTPSDTDELE